MLSHLFLKGKFCPFSTPVTKRTVSEQKDLPND